MPRRLTLTPAIRLTLFAQISEFAKTLYMLKLLDDILHSELISKYDERKKREVR